MKNKIKNKNAVLLIALCAMVYFVAYIGRLSYSANIAMVCKYYTVGGMLIDNGTAGIVGTCLFASYGVGQVINGLLCKRYNPRYSISIALFGSALMNILVSISQKDTFYFVCGCWFLNGFFQSILWSSLIRLLNRNLPKSLLKTAVLVMSFPVTLGTFAVYGISSLFSLLNKSFKGVFVVAAILMIAVAVVWLFSLDNLKRKIAEKINEEQTENEQTSSEKNEDDKSTVKGFIALFCLLAVFAVVNNFVKDGVTTWMPKILEEKYSLGEALATFLTLFLPLFSVFGATIALIIFRKAKNYVLTCGILYGASAVLITLVVILLGLPLWIVTLTCFMLVSLCMSGINNVLTGMFPINCPKTLNAGLIAGLIDGFCYVGSAITTYGLGSVSDNLGWDAVVYLLLALCAVMFVICLIYTIFNKIYKKRKI